ncbi:FHA domain-containing protein [Coniochaeta sp. 2T2.1]|nr:FHA domain-containing protein [Coniochaeta sp. 2T2.1]
MFTQVPAQAPTSSGLPHQHQTSSSPSRPSRLRGLSYLRNYTHTHLLSREHSGSGSGQSQQHSGQTTPSSPTAGPNLTQTASLSTSPTRPTHNLHRTTSASAATTLSSNQATAASNTSTASPRRNTNRLTLVNNHEAHPLSLAPPSRPNVSRRSTDSVLPPVLIDLANAVAEPRLSSPSTTGAATLSADPTNPNMVRTRSATMSETTAAHNGGTATAPDILPSIRFSTFYDPRAVRPSLTFSPVSRTLPTGTEVIKVGRYSERDSQPNIPPNIPSAAPVGFKSKVVSRRHCEFWCEGGKWYIKDVKSSSGTFLNHIRLSPPGTESKPFPINDGDIVQLGIDFKGGEEMIFRCVKMRLELNRGWQNKLNAFNLTTHKRLRNMTASSGSASSTQDCSICLNSIAPCQCLFVAPCSHTWHYKCIRSLLTSPSYPIFICPNCRAAADLEADVEDPEEWEQVDSEEDPNEQEQEGASLQPPPVSNGTPSHTTSATSRRSSVRRPSAPSPEHQHHDPDTMDVTIMEPPPPPSTNSSATSSSVSSSNPRPLVSNATSSPMPIPIPRSTSSTHTHSSGATTSSSSVQAGRNNPNTRTPSPTNPNGGPVMNGHEGPITPRNDAGPWVFDGSGVRMRLGDAGTTSLNAAAAQVAEDEDEMILDEIHVGGRDGKVLGQGEEE